MLDKAIKELVKENVIGKEDTDVARFLFGLLNFGANFKKAVTWTGVSKAEARVWWNNLKSSSYFTKDKKVYLDNDGEHDALEFSLMILVAQGSLKRT